MGGRCFRMFPTGVLLAFLILRAGAAPADPVYVWREAEDYTSATGQLRVLPAPLGMAFHDEEAERMFQARSGWGVQETRRTSGNAYLEREDAGTLPSETCAAYRFDIPRAGRYAFWLRFSSPPPCTRDFSLWLDRTPACPPNPYSFSHWNVWTWWHWGYFDAKGRAHGHLLEASPHTLYLGRMSPGLRLDKILITDDLHYVPCGANEHFYTGTFEPVQMRNAHGQTSFPPLASGWELVPENRWRVARNGSSHYLQAMPDPSSSEPALALIRDLRADCFLFECDVVPSVGEESDSPPRFGFLFEYASPEHYRLLAFEDRVAKLVSTWDGVTTETILSGGRLGAISAGSQLQVRRDRTSLFLSLGEGISHTIPLPAPAPGQIGFRAFDRMGWDNVRIDPLEGDYADFGNEGSISFADGWTVEKNVDGEEILLSPGTPYSECLVRVILSPAFFQDELGLGVFFPYATSRDNIEHRLVGGESPRVTVIRHTASGDSILLEQALSPEEIREGLIIEDAQGVHSVRAGRRLLGRSGENQLTQGRIGIATTDPSAVFALSVRPKEMVHESFTGHSLPSRWRVISGRWMPRPDSEGDGHLVSEGPGLLLLDLDAWRSYEFECSVRVEPGQALAVLFGWQRFRTFEVLCDADSLALRRVVEGSVVELGRHPLDDLGGGWIRIKISVSSEGIVVCRDDAPIITTKTKVGNGALGFENRGSLSLIDDVLVDLIEKEPAAPPGAQTVDPLLIETEQTLFR
ncbi:hypothetical protein HQ520_03595 [bacterium]|nr:hypothetical protein [bacterium]